MKGDEKLIIAKDLLENNLAYKIKKLSLDFTYKQLHITFFDGIQLYVVYNDHDEYSYSILFSKLELDRCRFDNYDDRWNVSTRPHHFHPRKKKEAIQSIMKGIPDQDMDKLIEFLKLGKIKESM